jgi:hypothetical protein
MNSVAEALNTLISAVNIAHNKGGVYSLEEAHHIYTAISYLNSLQQQAPAPAPQEEVAPQAPAQAPVEEDYSDPNIESQGY